MTDVNSRGQKKRKAFNVDGLSLAEPYFYVRNNRLHVTGTVAFTLHLTGDEKESIHELLSFSDREHKQRILRRAFQDMVNKGKTVMYSIWTEEVDR